MERNPDREEVSSQTSRESSSHIHMVRGHNSSLPRLALAPIREAQASLSTSIVSCEPRHDRPRYASTRNQFARLNESFFDNIPHPLRHVEFLSAHLDVVGPRNLATSGVQPDRFLQPEFKAPHPRQCRVRLRVLIPRYERCALLGHVVTIPKFAAQRLEVPTLLDASHHQTFDLGEVPLRYRSDQRYVLLDRRRKHVALGARELELHREPGILECLLEDRVRTVCHVLREPLGELAGGLFYGPGPAAREAAERNPEGGGRHFITCQRSYLWLVRSICRRQPVLDARVHLLDEGSKLLSVRRLDPAVRVDRAEELGLLATHPRFPSQDRGTPCGS